MQNILFGDPTTSLNFKNLLNVKARTCHEWTSGNNTKNEPPSIKKLFCINHEKIFLKEHFHHTFDRKRKN